MTSRSVNLVRGSASPFAPTGRARDQDRAPSTDESEELGWGPLSFR
jgi:hypothetical protein